ncbi:MAG: hypothetical protein WC588_04425 [Candidatus Micrarchaeia archaeon]
MKVLTSGQIRTQGLSGHIRSFLGFAVLTEKKYGDAVRSRDALKRHGEQLAFASSLCEILRKAASENTGYNRMKGGELSGDYGKIEVSMPASGASSAHFVHVRIPDNRRNNLIGVINVLSVSINFEHCGEEIHAHFSGRNSDEKFSKGDSAGIDGMAAYIRGYQVPD